jgi:hypothetical protein
MKLIDEKMNVTRDVTLTRNTDLTEATFLLTQKDFINNRVIGDISYRDENGETQKVFIAFYDDLAKYNTAIAGKDTKYDLRKEDKSTYLIIDLGVVRDNTLIMAADQC